MTDTNFTMVLKNGTEIKVIYPDRLGREYETDWLDRPGTREWNVDVWDSIRDVHKGYPRFIIGVWGTSYRDMDPAKVAYVVPFSEFQGVKPLSSEDLAKGQANHDEMIRRYEEEQREKAAHDIVNRIIASPSALRKLSEALDKLLQPQPFVDDGLNEQL